MEWQAPCLLHSRKEHVKTYYSAIFNSSLSFIGFYSLVPHVSAHALSGAQSLILPGEEGSFLTTVQHCELQQLWCIWHLPFEILRVSLCCWPLPEAGTESNLPAWSSSLTGPGGTSSAVIAILGPGKREQSSHAPPQGLMPIVRCLSLTSRPWPSLTSEAPLKSLQWSEEDIEWWKVEGIKTWFWCLSKCISQAKSQFLFWKKCMPWLCSTKRNNLVPLQLSFSF